MKRLSFRTAGESHGRGLVALLEGLPAGLSLEMGRDVDPDLKRRQGGYGRGRRMKIESDRAEVISGVRLGETLGSPTIPRFCDRFTFPGRAMQTWWDC